jgi:hypothetical protein
MVTRVFPMPALQASCTIDHVTGTEDAGKGASLLKRGRFSLLAHQFSPLIYGVAGKH